MEMTDEIDFNVEALRYVNIGRSRHRGVEAGLMVSGGATVFANYALQSATYAAGDNTGNQLKAIPRHTINAGVTFVPTTNIEATFSTMSARGAWIDDANTLRLDGYTRVDARTAYTLRAARLFVEMRNVFGAEYSTGAFLDPSGSGQLYHYPAAGRVLRAGIGGVW
jgi:iron complex outermembrane receptor protein